MVLLGIVTATAAAAGCATPAPFYRLTPRSRDVIWVAGRASMQKQAAGVRAAVAFDHQDGYSLRLRVEMINESNVPIDVKPQDFSYVSCFGEGVGSCGAAKPVVDPERVLMTLDERESREAADSVNTQAVMVPLLLLGIAADVGGHGGGMHTAAIASGIDHEEYRHDSTMQTIGGQRDLWANAAFRRNTLMPGAGTAGFVDIPLEENVKFVWVTVRAAGQVLPFCFEQTHREVAQAAPPTTKWRNH